VILEQLVFADESGIHKQGARHCLITGYIGTPKQWQKLRQAWQKALERYDVPAFHGTEFFKIGNRVGPYKSWDDARARRFLLRLCCIINKRELRPVGGGVEWAAFDSFTLGERRHLTGGAYHKGKGKFMRHGAPTKPYYLFLSWLLHDVFQHSADGAKIHIFLDRQNLYFETTVQMISDIYRTLRAQSDNIMGNRRLGYVGEGDSTQEPAFQAADLHVHSWYGFIERGVEHMSPDRIAAMNELAIKRPSIKVFNKEALEEQFREPWMTPEIRERMRQS